MPDMPMMPAMALSPAKPDMQRHHCPLTKANKQQAVAGQLSPLQFCREKGLEPRRCSRRPGRALRHGKGLDWPPLVGGRHAGDLQGRVRRDKSGARKRRLDHCRERR
jgi:hypothetical protein